MDDAQFLANTLLEAYGTVVKVNVKELTFVFLVHDSAEIPLYREFTMPEFRKIIHEDMDIHPEDRYRFREGVTRVLIREKCNRRQSGVLFSYRRFMDGRYRWSRMSILVPHGFDLEQNPYVLVTRELLSEEASDITETMSAYNRKIVKVVKCNLSKMTYRIVKQRESEEYLRRKGADNNILNEAWLTEEGLVHPGDLSYFVQFMDQSLVQDLFSEGKDELSFFYRRKIGNFYHWVRASVTKAIEYTEEDHIYTYIIEDIDGVLTNLLEQKNIPGIWEEMTRDSQRMDRYYANLRQILSYYTQQFLEFYLIDLKNDLYIMYKIQPDNINGKLPYSGSYTDTFLPYMRKVIAQGLINEDNFNLYTIDALRSLLVDKASIEIRAKTAKGKQVRVIYLKMTSEYGVPSKVLCTVIPCEQEHRLKVSTFGNFEVYDASGNRIKFTRKQSKQVLAYLIDRQGFPVSPKEIAEYVLEKSPDDLNAIKYVSTLVRNAVQDLKKAGYEEIIIKEWNSLRIDTSKIDCDYYHLLNGDISYLRLYNNEYMKEYSWAEETNSEILHYSSI